MDRDNWAMICPLKSCKNGQAVKTTYNWVIIGWGWFGCNQISFKQGAADTWIWRKKSWDWESRTRVNEWVMFSALAELWACFISYLLAFRKPNKAIGLQWWSLIILIAACNDHDPRSFARRAVTWWSWDEDCIQMSALLAPLKSVQKTGMSSKHLYHCLFLPWTAR